MKEKIGIISDTHGLLRPEVLEILKDCKYILHAGDVNKVECVTFHGKSLRSTWK